METNYSSKSIFSGISKAYLEESDFRTRFYTYNPLDESSWTERIDKVSKIAYDRKQLIDSLMHTNTNLEAGQNTLDNIRKLKKDTTLCVITGQQTGILGGPLYTIYKASTAIKKAKDLSRKYGIDVVPVFWMASEDHDFEEVREISLIDDGKLKKVKVDKKPGNGRNNPFKTLHNYSYLKEPVSWVDINTSVKSLLIEAGHSVRDSEFEDWCHDIFFNTVKDDETLSQWFGRIYLKLFEKEGLIIADPMDEGMRQMGIDFLKKALVNADDIVASVIDKGNELGQMGHKALIEPRDGATGLYYLERGERLPIIHEEGMYTIREGDEREAFCKDELLERMESHPEEFSTNVILRPLIQDVYFPTVSYVAGPGEAAYYAQLNDVYKVFGMEMPIILPRENYTVCSCELKSSLDALDLSLEEIIKHDQLEVERDLLKEMDRLDVENLFKEFTADFNNKYSALLNKLEKIDGDIKPISEKNHELIMQQFDYLKQKSYRFHRRNHKGELKAVKEIYQWIKPSGGLQERKLSLLNILSLAGPEFIRYITNEIKYDLKHRIIVLK